jgi:biotin-(acetyl-CoA carboxylase) ligase
MLYRARAQVSNVVLSARQHEEQTASRGSKWRRYSGPKGCYWTSACRG